MREGEGGRNAKRLISQRLSKTVLTLLPLVDVDCFCLLVYIYLSTMQIYLFVHSLSSSTFEGSQQECSESTFLVRFQLINATDARQ